MRPERVHRHTVKVAQKGLIIQLNVNHSARAQDLLTQSITEWDAGLAIVTEQHRILFKLG